VYGLGPREIIKEEVNGVDMNNIGTAYELDRGGGKRIPRRPKKRDPNNLRAIDHFARRKDGRVNGFEEAIQCDDADPVTRGYLRCRKFMNHGFNPANRGVELTYDVDNEHAAKNTNRCIVRPMAIKDGLTQLGNVQLS
jgi:hypothetical protein